jgi:signal peptidase I
VTILKTLKSHKKLFLLGLFSLLAIAGVWAGLRIALRTESPLLVVDFAGMRPALVYGDVIMLQGATKVSEVNAAPNLTGDIIVFRKPSDPATLVTRRVIDKTFQENTWYLRTQADESTLPDLWGSGQNSEDTLGDGSFHQKFLVGKIVGKIPLLGYFPLYLRDLIRNPVAVIVLFLAVLLLFILVKHSPFVKRARASV